MNPSSLTVNMVTRQAFRNLSDDQLDVDSDIDKTLQVTLLSSSELDRLCVQAGPSGAVWVDSDGSVTPIRGTSDRGHT